ncbi:MAG: NAD-dependent epimerase/dehydratase family protein [Actinomycetota bacterium]|nr:NAD-dependent epimerase/dehydratase family protein [Actinomycetota bacterium]
MPGPPSERLTVAVTGVAGYIGRRLLEQLADDDRVERILGFDIRPPAFDHPKFVFDHIDVRDDTLQSRLGDVDVLVHLAFIMDPIRDEAEMRDVNVNGSQNVFRCAGKARVQKVVYTSSAVVYGAHPDNDVPLTEESRLRANLDFSYPAHKLEVEYVVREIAEEYPDLSFTIFRPAIVFGPHVDNAWSHSLELPVLLSVRDHRAPLQFVHEDDVAAALHLAVTSDLQGVFNLAAEGWLEADDMVTLIGRRRVELPEPIAFALVDRMWSLGLAEAPAGMLHYVMHPWVVSTEKLERAGFRCRHTNLEIFMQAVARAGDHIRLGERRVSKGGLKKGTLVGLGVAGALVSLRTAKKRLSARQ